MGIGSIMVPMFWHTTKGEELIKAGTPIAQLILIPKDEIEHRNLNIVTDPKFKEEQRISNLILTNQITVNNNKWKKYEVDLKVKRWCGISDRKDTSYDVKELGWNYYMNEFSAGLGLIQLKKLDKLNQIRRNIAKRYYNEIELEQKMPYVAGSSYHFYWIITRNRDEIMQRLKQNGIETGIHYKPIHKMSMYNAKNKLPVTENVGKKIILSLIHI